MHFAGIFMVNPSEGCKARLYSQRRDRGVDDTGAGALVSEHFVIFAEDVSQNGTGQVFDLGGQEGGMGA